MFLRIIAILFIGSLFFTSCRSKKGTVSTQKKNKTEQVIINKKEETTEVIPEKKEIPAKASYIEIVEIYIENYSNIAKEEMIEFGIPASITLAQGILESGAGRADLTKRSNNHFGIKCHNGWDGERVYHDDDELQECFRKYKDPKYSFRDHSLFLSQRSRYKNLFHLKKNDYKAWAKGLRKAGYATDPKYPNKLIDIIERFELYKFDDEVLKRSKRDKKKDKKKNRTYIVEKGDTLYSISTRFNISLVDLKKKNKLKSNTIEIGQILKLPSN